MKPIFYRTALSAALATSIISCGGGSGVAGIGGSGFVITGTVTGFGSVFVNGVEFETSGTVFDIDDSGAGTQDDLAVGMVVTVNGTVNADGISGNANSISFDDQLQGPVSGPLVLDNDLVNLTFSVLGTTVRVNTDDTLFDDRDGLSTTAFNFGSIAPGNHVEISGFYDAAGVLVATRIELKAEVFSPNADIVELKGTVAGFTSMSTPFMLSGLSGISINASAAAIDDLPGGLVDGASVEVKGTCSDLVCSTINATRVEGQSGFDDADKISVEGLITGFVDSSNFKVNGISVNASSASLQPNSLVLRDGQRVEVEGPIMNNVIQASSVELRGGSAKVHAAVSSVDSASGNFAVGVNGGNISIIVTTATEMETPIMNGNFVNLRGYENDTGGITATQVEVGDADAVMVQGNVTSADFIINTSITILGVTFDVTPGNGETEFEDKDGNPVISQTDFQNLLVGTTLVKVKDKTPTNGVADEIEIELD